jgi:hypothetical protein
VEVSWLENEYWAEVKRFWSPTHNEGVKQMEKTATQVNEEQVAKEHKASMARERLLSAMPYFRNAIQKAKKDGVMKLGILQYNEDGSGKIEAAFEFEDFFADIEAIIDAPPSTEEDLLKAQAALFCQTHGLHREQA